MAMKIKFVNEEIITPIFKDIKEGEMFVFNGNLCMKIGKVYSVSDIRYEVDECHDLTDSEDIDSEKYNTVSISTGNVFPLNDDDKVTRVDVDITVKERK